MAQAIGVRAGRFDLLWQPGANLELEFVYKSGGSPVELTNATVLCHVRDAPGGTLLVDLSSSFTVDGPNGTLTLSAPPTLTDDLIQHGIWDLKIVYPDSSADRILEGRVVLAPAVSAT